MKKEKPTRDISNTNKSSYYEKVFFIVGAVFMLIMAVGVCITRGEYLNAVMFPPYNQGFIDHFQVLRGQFVDNPYTSPTSRSMYPALVNLIYLGFAQLITPEVGASWINGTLELRLYRNAITGVVILLILMIWSSIYVIKRLYKESGINNNIFALLMVFSIPSMYGIIQGNTTLLASTCIGGFILLKDSPKKLARDFSLFLLAFAGVLKIYPVVFGFLLLRDKRLKDAIKAAIIFFVLFIAPFAFYGFDSIFAMVRNITNFGVRPAQIGNISFSQTIIDLLHIDGQEHQLFVKGFIMIFVPLMFIIATITVEDDWKAVALAALLCVGIPDGSKKYTLVFMIVPVALFLSQCRDKAQKQLRTGLGTAILNWIYLALFILILFPFPLSWKFEVSLESKYQQHIDSINVIINRVALFILAALLGLEWLVGLFRRTKQFKNRSRWVVSMILIIVLIFDLSICYGSRRDHTGTIYSFCGVTEANYESVGGLTDSLEPGNTVDQRFYAKRNQLTRIIIRVSMNANKSKSSPIEVALLSCKDDSLIWKQTYDTTVFTAWGLTSLYPDEKVMLEPGEEYRIQLRSVDYKDDSTFIGLYHAVNRNDSPDTYATVNGEPMDYNYAMYVFEKY